ncbi:MAG: hypothetical protein JKX98_12360 [Alcanivoracaceae bacterium]|nr:hypothetical protein [Alcanivoracaceae bacterium]
MSYLFISHSSKNNFHAIAIRDWLVEQGWDELFLDFLSISYNKIARIQLRLGNTDEILNGYQQSLEIRKKLIKLDPNN